MVSPPRGNISPREGGKLKAVPKNFPLFAHVRRRKRRIFKVLAHGIFKYAKRERGRGRKILFGNESELAFLIPVFLALAEREERATFTSFPFLLLLLLGRHRHLKRSSSTNLPPSFLPSASGQKRFARKRRWKEWQMSKRREKGKRNDGLLSLLVG